MKYQLAIVHRVCPVLAKTAAVYTDKLEMVKATTTSLARALAGIRTRLVVILDGCGSEYEQLFDAVFLTSQVDGVDYERIATPAIGNNATYRKQLELLSELSEDAEYLYFSEDDYLYEAQAFSEMMEFLQKPGVDFVTPLDHPDYYQPDRERALRCSIRATVRRHWREIGTTCCTFMLKSADLARARQSLSYYARGGSDYVMGLLLTKFGCYSLSSVIGGVFRYWFCKPRNWMQVIPAIAWLKLGLRLPLAPRFRLWSPMPSLTVHLCIPSLPPLSARLVSNMRERN